jgi:glucosamine-6-phosphate deaminase
MSLVDSFEKIPVQIFEDDKKASASVAREIANLIIHKQKEGKHCVLGLATGSTPKTMYAELVKLHKNEGLSFKNVITFNLDEYFPMEADALQSYNRFMHVHLFSQVDIDPANTHVPDGTINKDDIRAYAASYEKKIEEAGGKVTLK